MNDKNALKDAVIKSWDIIVDGLAKDKKSLKRDDKNVYKVESRSKLKSLGLAIREREDPSEAVLHLVKYAEYMLPRSNLTATLSAFLTAVEDLREKYHDNPRKLREVVGYMVGYMMWSIDSVCNIFTIAGNDKEKARTELENMIGLEMSVVGADGRTTEIVDKLMEWKKGEDESKKGGDRK